MSNRVFSTANAFFKRAYRYPILVIGLWCLLFAQRPFTLGFFHDDWWSLVELTTGRSSWSLDLLSLFMNFNSGYSSRPMLGFICFILSSLGEISPVSWQLFAALTMLGIGLGIRGLLLKRLAAVKAEDYLAADIAGCIWLSAPWQMGATCWPIMGGSLFSAIFFLLAFLTIRIEHMGWLRLLSFFLLLSSSFLTYEAFYFIWFPLLALIFALNFGSMRWSLILKLVAAAGLSQILCVAYNRYIQSYNGAASKSANANYLDLFISNMYALPQQVLASVNEVRTSFVVTLTVLGILYLCFVIHQLIKRQAKTALVPLLVVLAFVISAAALSNFLYSAVGYSLISVGMQSRTMLPFTFIGAVAVGALLSNIPFALRYIRIPTILAWAFLVGLLSYSTQNRIVEWEVAWTQEKLILEKAPIFRFKDLKETEGVLFIGPSYSGSVVIFGAQWDMTGAINNLPELRAGRQAFKDLIKFYPATQLYTWEYRNQILYQSSGKAWTQEFPITRLFVWDFYKKKYYEAQEGFRIDPPA